MLRSTSWLLLLSSLLLTLSLPVTAEPPSFTEGVHYKLIDPPLPAPKTNQAEVIEMFWYGCPHCYHFEPLLEKWIKNKSDQVTFIRVPAVFRDSWMPGAQAFYTAQALGVADKIHRPLFDAIHLKKLNLNTKTALADFFATQGIAKDEFLSTFDSFAVQGKVQQAVATTRASGITGVPAMIVNGKYRTDADLAGSFQRMLEVVNYLVAQASKK